MPFGFMKHNKQLQQIEQLTIERKFAEAAKLLAGLLEKSPDEPTLLLHAAILDYEKGDLKAAQSLTEKALKLAPDNPVLHLAMGEILHKLKKYDDSVASLKQCLQLSPDNPKAEYLMGLNCVAQKHYEEANIHFEVVAREDRDFMMARLLTLAEAAALKK